MSYRWLKPHSQKLSERVHKHTVLKRMNKNHSSLLSAICGMRLGVNRLNDVTVVANELYRIDFFSAKARDGKEYEGNCLKDSKEVEYVANDYQLAALRVATGTISSPWLEDFKNDPNGSILQTYVKTNNIDGEGLKAMRFKAVQLLKIRNSLATGDVPVYKDFCYEGAAGYLKAIRALLKDKDADFYTTREYSDGVREARETLHATPLKPGKATDDNIVYVPVFQIQ